MVVVDELQRGVMVVVVDEPRPVVVMVDEPQAVVVVVVVDELLAVVEVVHSAHLRDDLLVVQKRAQYRLVSSSIKNFLYKLYQMQKGPNYKNSKL